MSAPVYRLGCRVGQLAAKCTLESGEVSHFATCWALGKGDLGAAQAATGYEASALVLAIGRR